MDLNAIQQIAEGIMSNKVVSIGYIDSKGKSTIRKVEPYELDADANKLMAYCLERQAIRHFKLNKITFAEVLNQLYLLRYPVSVNGVTVNRMEESE